MEPKHLKEPSLEWALQHLSNFYDSDFYPKLFEFKALKHDWNIVKDFLLKIDLNEYIPSTPNFNPVPKLDYTYRIAHQLDPIDNLIITALIYEECILIEKNRVQEDRNIACSYRIKPDHTGSFFDKENSGYISFIQRAETLSSEFHNGFVLVMDIVDFYNQIYVHRVNNALEEAGSGAGKIVEEFLLNLNSRISRGIPVGPAFSIIVAEAIMSDIDNKILGYTSSFTRYVDDIYIFFENEDDAKKLLHDITEYLYSIHRLVLSTEKTKIIATSEFIEIYLQDEEKKERDKIREKVYELDSFFVDTSKPMFDNEYSDYYNEPEDLEYEPPEFDDLEEKEQFEIRGNSYKELFEETLNLSRFDLGLIRHLLRKATKYRIKNLVPIVLSKFDQLLPVCREVILYLEKLLDSTDVKNHEIFFQEMLDKEYLKIPYINIWIFTLLQKEIFNEINLNIDYSKILRVRERALIAKRQKNLTWVKGFKNSIDSLGSFDKRAVLYAATILSEDELKHWLRLESGKGNIVNKSICDWVISNKKSKNNI